MCSKMSSGTRIVAIFLGILIGLSCFIVPKVIEISHGVVASQAILQMEQETNDFLEEVIEPSVIIDPVYETEIQKLESYRKLLDAMYFVESSNGVNLYNEKSGAIGPYQICKPYWIDAIKFNHQGGTYQDCMNKTYSEYVIKGYAKRYEPQAYEDMNLEVLAKLHYGGLFWRDYPKDCERYWNKIKKHLDNQ